MPKLWKWLVPLVLLLALSLSFLFLKDELFGPFRPWDQEVVFSYPQYGISDQQGNSYIVDDSLRRVIAIDEQGEVKYILSGGKRSYGDFFYVQDLSVDDQGRLYLLNNVWDTKGLFVEREEILRYSPDGELESILYRIEHKETPSTLIQRGYIFKLRVQANRLYWFELQRDRLSRLSLTLDRSILEEVNRMPFPLAAQIISDLDSSQRGSFVASLKNGQIRRYTWDGRYEVLLDGEENEMNRYIPWEIVQNPRGDVYFVDFYHRAILTLVSQFQAKEVLDRSIREQKNLGDEATIYYRLAANPQDVITTTDDYAFFKIDTQDGTIQSFEKGIFSSRDILFRWFVHFLALVWIFLALYLVFYFYSFVLKKKVSLVLKQVLILAPLLAVAVFFVSNMIIQEFLTRLTTEKLHKVSAMAQNFSQILEPQWFSGFESQKDYWSDDYQKIRSNLHRALGYNQDPWNEDYYFALYRVLDSELHGFMYLNDRIGLFHPFDWFSDPQSVYRTAYNGEVEAVIETDISGDWLYAVAPVMDPETGKVVAIVEVGTDLFTFMEENRALYMRTIRLTTGVTLGILLILILFTYLVLQTLRVLASGVNQLAQGKWDVEIPVRSNDEVTDLSKTFNHMSQSIRTYMEEIETLNKSYRRFVPEQFLTFLGHPSVVNVKLGDQIQQEMTVLFSDIRSFTTLSEQMTPEENFNFLNSYLNLMGPHIRTHGGFIDKYIGDAIMALFPHGEYGADAAVNAAVEIKFSLMDFNKERQKERLAPIEMGIGMHTGMLMLGILGESERMEGTVISDNVNLASRLEALTKHYGVSLIVSQTLLENLSHPERFSTRYLGKVQVKGKTQGMGIYEVIEGDKPEIRELKLRSKKKLEDGIRFYEEKNFPQALEIFQSLLNVAHTQKVAHIYKMACEAMMKVPLIPENWNGSVALKFK